ncbi:MAG: zinc finger Ran-binding domain-containing protein [Candidatus Thorarchaeota archaeon]
MPILATAYYGQHQIVVEYSNWTSKHWVTYDGRKVSEKQGLIRGTHYFQAVEDGETIQYEATIGGWNAKVTVKRNGIIIFSPDPGFRPPPVDSDSNKTKPHQEVVVKEVVKEVVLVVCPHCNHRNDSSRRTCEKCHASI